MGYKFLTKSKMSYEMMFQKACFPPLHAINDVIKKSKNSFRTPSADKRSVLTPPLYIKLFRLLYMCSM